MTKRKRDEAPSAISHYREGLRLIAEYDISLPNKESIALFDRAASQFITSEELYSNVALSPEKERITLADLTLRQGKAYSSKAFHQKENKDYQSAYVPIKNQHGRFSGRKASILMLLKEKMLNYVIIAVMM